MSRYLKDFQARLIQSGYINEIPVKDILNCQSFIIHGDNIWSKDLFDDMDTSEIAAVLDAEKLSYESINSYDSPFKCICIERPSIEYGFFRGCDAINMHEDIVIKALTAINANSKMIDAAVAATDSILTNTMAIMLYEVSPRKWIGFYYVEMLGMGASVIKASNVHVDCTLLNILPMIDKCRYATENYRYTLKTRIGRNFIRQSKTSSIIHMYPKGDITTVKSRTGNKINFDIKFMVRGHWRVLEPGKIGKNRAGEYNVSNMTWVTEHEKGNKDAPLINQTRIVHQDKQPAVV